MDSTSNVPETGHMIHIPNKEQTSLSFMFQSKSLVNATCYYSLERNPQVVVWIYLYITSHLVLGLYLTLLLKIFISDGHIDDNF